MNRLGVLVIISLLTLELGAGFSPWVYRSPAVLQLTAPHLAEYVKFLADVRLGIIHIQRLYFLLPLAVTALSVPLVVVNQTLGLHWLLNWGLRFTVIPMTLALISPVWAPSVLMNDEFRLQTIVACIAVILAITAPMFKNLPLRWLLLAVTICSTIGVSLALWQFYMANNAIADTYSSAISLGLGGWLTIFGTVGLMIATVIYKIKTVMTP